MKLTKEQVYTEVRNESVVSFLTFEAVSLSDMGNYTCLAAENNADEPEEKDAEIIVTGECSFRCFLHYPSCL